MEYAVNFVAKNSGYIVVDVMNTIEQAQVIYKNIDSSSLERKIVSLQEKKEKIIELYANGILGMDEIKSTMDKYCKEIEAAENQLSDYNTAINKLSEQSDAIKSALEYISTREQSEDTFKRLLERLTVYKDRIEFKFNDIPFSIEIKYETKGVKAWYETTITSCKIV